MRLPPKTASTGARQVASDLPRAAHASGSIRRTAALDGLSRATGDYEESSRPAQSERRRTGWGFTLLASLAVGIAVMLATPAQYRYTADLRLEGSLSEEHSAYYRAALLNLAWSGIQTEVGADHPAQSWSVETPSPNTLRLTLSGLDRRLGVDRVKSKAEAIIVGMERAADELARRPSEPERQLLQRTAALQGFLAELNLLLTEAVAHLPTVDPDQRHAALVADWEALRSSFAATSLRFEEASVAVRQLQSEPEPTHGIVLSENRDEAMRADLALQQDLAELAVKLTELKLHLLHVGRDSADDLERLRTAVQELRQRIESVERGHASDGVQETLDAMAGQIGQYATSLEHFRRVWTKAFESLEPIEIDPLNGELLDLHARVQMVMHEFLFRAAKQLAVLRQLVGNLGDFSANQARYHVLQSDLTRGFHAVQQAHHRLEFATGALEPATNFKLDAALVGARGLRRRSQLRIRRVDGQLQAEAAMHARRERTTDLVEAKRLHDQLRATVDHAVTRLLSVQDDLNVAVSEARVSVRSVLLHDLLKTQVEQVHRDLADVEETLRTTEELRATRATPSPLRLVSCEAHSDSPALASRLSLGGVGMLATLLAVGLTQWWVGRRS